LDRQVAATEFFVDRSAGGRIRLHTLFVFHIHLDNPIPLRHVMSRSAGASEVRRKSRARVIAALKYGPLIRPAESVVYFASMPSMANTRKVAYFVPTFSWMSRPPPSHHFFKTSMFSYRIRTTRLAGGVPLSAVVLLKPPARYMLPPSLMMRVLPAENIGRGLSLRV